MKGIFSQEYGKGDSLGIVAVAFLLVLLKPLIGALRGAVDWRPHARSLTVLLFVIAHSLDDSQCCDDSIFKIESFSVWTGCGPLITDQDASKLSQSVFHKALC